MGYNESGYAMGGYFRSMETVGEWVARRDEKNEAALKAVEAGIREKAERARAAGRPDESLRRAGQMTATQRVLELVDEGSFLPLGSLFNPGGNADGSTAIIKGLGRIAGRWAMIVASDNKKLAGAWVPGQAENIIRAADTAKILRIPLVYVLNCSGVKLDEQEKVYADRRGGGTPFYRNAELQQAGVPVMVGIFGTNPAGGGYHSISPTVLIAHRDANMAVGGAGILGGMSPKGGFDLEGALQLIEATAGDKSAPPGSADVHFYDTGFFREVYDSEQGVLSAMRRYVGYMPAYDPEFFRVASPREPRFDPGELYSVVPANQKKPYSMYDVLARLFDGGEMAEYKKEYGPEIITGLVKADGLLLGVVANAQGFIKNYPEYREKSMGVGGKLYRQGLVKMNEFVTLCARDRLPMVWLQDTTGIDVGDEAERAELLGLGQSLIYSIEQSGVPQLEITLRKGTAAAHYVLGGPQGNNTNAFSLGTAATEICVMNGETAAAAMYSRRLMKEHAEGGDLAPVIEKMNALVRDYAERSRPDFCAEQGFVDEIAEMPALRRYITAFAGAAYQNPRSICAPQHMMAPRAAREYLSRNVAYG